MTAEPDFEFTPARPKPRKRMTREEAVAVVEAGIGSRPDLPPSEQIVREIRDMLWGPAPEHA